MIKFEQETQGLGNPRLLPGKKGTGNEDMNSSATHEQTNEDFLSLALSFGTFAFSFYLRENYYRVLLYF